MSRMSCASSVGGWAAGHSAPGCCVRGRAKGREAHRLVSGGSDWLLLQLGVSSLRQRTSVPTVLLPGAPRRATEGSLGYWPAWALPASSLGTKGLWGRGVQRGRGRGEGLSQDTGPGGGMEGDRKARGTRRVSTKKDEGKEGKIRTECGRDTQTRKERGHRSKGKTFRDHGERSAWVQVQRPQGMTNQVSSFARALGTKCHKMGGWNHRN